MNNGFNLTKDSLAILLICSNLAINNENETKPYTVRQWNILADKLARTSMGRPSSFFETDENIWSNELLLKPEEVSRIKTLISRSGNLGIELENLSNLGIRITTRAERNYPKRLKDILKKDCPPVIFYCGDMTICENDGVSIVGSRNVDDVGLNFTTTISKKCTVEGFNIVSGGAKGVDSVAQDTALQSGGKVVSFISDGLMQKIKRKEIRENITKGNLLMMSAVNPKSGFKVYSAMDRNKYIYALSNYAIVVSSDYNKGGTWTGAMENFDKKWVPMFVRKDNNIPIGNKEFIKKGVNPIEIDMFEDRDMSIRAWLEDNSSHLSLDSDIKQIDMNDLLSYGNESESNMIAETNAQIDLYNVVWTYMKKVLSEPKTTLELCKIFNINKIQMDIWIKRALDEKKIIKLSGPVRYVDINIDFKINLR